MNDSNENEFEIEVSLSEEGTENRGPNETNGNSQFDQAFERAGFKVMEWNQVSPVIRALIQGKQGRGKSGQTIYGKPKAWDGVYYFVQKTPEGCIWSRVWIEDKGPVFRSLKINPTSSEIANIIKETEAEEGPKIEKLLANEVRDLSKATLANSKKTNGAR